MIHRFDDIRAAPGDVWLRPRRLAQRCRASPPASWIGLSGEDLEWLLERVPAEVMILRPAPDDKREISAAASVNGHF